jgi:hypothetical protein
MPPFFLFTIIRHGNYYIERDNMLLTHFVKTAIGFSAIFMLLLIPEGEDIYERFPHQQNKKLHSNVKLSLQGEEDEP